MKPVKLLVFLIVFLSGCCLWAALEKAELKEKVDTSKTADGEQPKKKKIGVDQSDFMPSANNFGFITSYAVSYDDLEQVNKKTFSHNLSFAGTYSFDQKWSSYAAIGFSHDSYGANIVRDNDNDQFHQVSNLNLGAVYTRMSSSSLVNRKSTTFNIGLPVSERSRVDKEVANLSLTNFLQSHTWKDFSLFNRLTGNFVWNTQKFSVFNDDQMNRDWLISDSFGATYMLTPRWGVRWNFRLDMVRYLDGSWNMSFGDNISTFANLSGFQLFASMINNSYQENERIDLGYYDKYRRVFLGGITYAF